MADESAQRISRLTPLKAVLELIDARVEAVRPQRWAIATTQGYGLAEDVAAFECPEHATALRDGFAVEAAAIADAGPYAPISLQPVRRVDLGDPMPAGTDAILPFDAVELRGERAEAVAAIAAGEGVLPAGGDTAARAVLRRAGEKMRSVDLAIMQAAAIKGALVREPRIALVLGGEPGTHPLQAVLGLLIRAVSAAGATISGGLEMTLDAAAADPNSDFIVAVGGTGSGRRDSAARTLARLGRVEIHGIAISPGETAALGFIGTRPVLLVPGRLDAALTVWLMIGRHLVARLAGGRVEDSPAALPLARKVTSAIGLAELIPVRCADGMAEPLASGYLPLASLARSDGWIVAAAESEGYAAGTPVAVRPWP